MHMKPIEPKSVVRAVRGLMNRIPIASTAGPYRRITETLIFPVELIG